MDFFNQQDLARKRTRRLLMLFVAAVATLVGALNLVAAALVWYGADKSVNTPQTANNLSLSGIWTDPYNWQHAGWVTLGTLAVIISGSLIKWLSLQGGGKVVASSLGGRLLIPNSKDFYERRLLNVVEEMAIASGMPVPPVYVLPDSSINAFAAGYQASDAVIGVTEGCMKKLTRDQLQGVIGHEFSHIANGDMRLNIRLMALLYGILFIALIGRFLLESGAHGSRIRSRDQKNGLPLWAIGLAMTALGYLGVLFGNLIKAGVSRQREFLADASAVQYTRNPQSIADALKVIGHGAGSRIRSPEREETAHLFFGSAMNFRFSGFATHPPLEDRIRRIQPNWDGRYLAPQTLQQAKQESPELVVADNSSQGSSAASTLVGVSSELNSDLSAALLAAEAHAEKASVAKARVENASVENDTGTDSLQRLADLQAMAREPFSAQTLILCLLMAPAERFIHSQQQDIVLRSLGQGLYKEVLRCSANVRQLPASQRLPLVERAIPTLKQLSDSQYRSFHTALVAIIKSDGQIDLFEWCLFRLLNQYLDNHFNQARPVKESVKKPEQVKQDIAVLLSYMAHHGHDDDGQADSAFNGCLADGAFGSLGIQYQPVDHRLKPLNQSLTRLTGLYPHVKGRLIKSLVACARYDGELRTVERDLIQAIAAILESPVPAGVLDSPDVR